MDHTVWTEDFELILDDIRQNCLILSNYNKTKYFELKKLDQYFRIPTIILSAINSVFSVGLQPWLSQEYISIINCLISLLCGIIVSIEMFLNIQSDIEMHILLAKQFQLLALDIYKTITLERHNRVMDGKAYLDEKFNAYLKLFEKMNPLELDKKLKKDLNTIQLNRVSSSSKLRRDEAGPRLFEPIEELRSMNHSDSSTISTQTPPLHIDEYPSLLQANEGWRATAHANNV